MTTEAANTLIDPYDLLSSGDLASLLPDLSRKQIWLKTRRSDFPKPMLTFGGVRLWHRAQLNGQEAELEAWRRQTNRDPYDLLCANDLGELWPHYTASGRYQLTKRADFPKPAFERKGLNLRLWQRVDLEDYTAARFWLQSEAGKIRRLQWIGKNCGRQAPPPKPPVPILKSAQILARSRRKSGKPKRRLFRP